MLEKMNLFSSNKDNDKANISSSKDYYELDIYNRILLDEAIKIAEEHGFRLVKEIQTITDEVSDGNSCCTMVMINDSTKDLLFISSEDDMVNFEDCEIIIFRTDDSYNPEEFFKSTYLDYAQKGIKEKDTYDNIHVIDLSQQKDLFQEYASIMECTDLEKVKSNPINWDSLPFADLYFILIPEYFTGDILMRTYVYKEFCTDKEFQIIEKCNIPITFAINFFMLMQNLEKEDFKVPCWNSLFRNRYVEFAKVIINQCINEDELELIIKIAFAYCERTNVIGREEMIKYVQALKDYLDKLNIEYAIIGLHKSFKIKEQKVYPDDTAYSLVDAIING